MTDMFILIFCPCLLFVLVLSFVLPSLEISVTYEKMLTLLFVFLITRMEISQLL